MNFLEALELNKTKMVRMTGQNVCCEGVGSLRDKVLNGIIVGCKAEWEIYEPPKVIEFVCEWNVYMSYDRSMITAPFIPEMNLEELRNGRRWKVRCEEIK